MEEPDALTLRSVVPALLLAIAASLMTPACRAGSYVGVNTVAVVPATTPSTYRQIPYSGGQYVDHAGTENDTLTTDGYGGSSGGGTSASCSGPLSASWKWTPDQGKDMTTDPPPTQVIVSESCTVSVTVVSPVAQGTYDTDMGKKGTVTWVAGGNNTASVTSVRYSVQPGGASVTLKPGVSPKAVAAALGDTAGVRYTATVSPIFVKISGTKDPANGDFRALTGQQITGTLIGIPANIKIMTYTWSFTGGTLGNPIKTWDGTNNTQQLFPLLAADLTKTDTTGNGINVSPLSFYDQVADTVITKCAVSLTFPDGKTDSVNAQAPPVMFLKPTGTKWGIKSGLVRSPGGITGLFGVPGDKVYTDGQSWHDVIINVPSPFSGRQFSFVQTVIPILTVYRQLPQGSIASSYYVQTNNGASGLDPICPYYTPYTIPTQPVRKELVGDSPQVAIPDLNVTITVPPTDDGGTQWNKTTASDQFTTWLIYMPPGNNSIWVPLQKYSWSWSGTMSDGPAWHQTAGNPTAGSTPTASDTDTPPSWGLVHNANDTFKSP